MEYDPEEHYEMAYFTVYTFYASAAINLTIILGVTTMELFGSLKRLYAYCFKKKSKNDEKSDKNIFPNSYLFPSPAVYYVVHPTLVINFILNMR